MYLWREKNPGAHARLQRKYRKRHPKKAQASVKAWIDKHPDYEKERAKRRYAADPKKRNESAKRWEIKYPDKHKALRKKYYKQRYALRKNGLTAQERKELLKTPCVYCGEPATEIDHILPISRGGNNIKENLAPACRSCNASKFSKTPEEWRNGLCQHQSR